MTVIAIESAWASVNTQMSISERDHTYRVQSLESGEAGMLVSKRILARNNSRVAGDVWRAGGVAVEATIIARDVMCEQARSAGRRRAQSIADGPACGT